MTAAQVPLEMVRFDRVMEREYQKVHPYQFVRELVQNALDAGATEVTAGPCWPLLADPADASHRETRQHWREMVAAPGILAVAYTLHSRRRVLDVLVASQVKGLAKRRKGKK
jgi:hypothetical protein